MTIHTKAMTNTVAHMLSHSFRGKKILHLTIHFGAGDTRFNKVQSEVMPASRNIK